MIQLIMLCLLILSFSHSAHFVSFCASFRPVMMGDLLQNSLPDIGVKNDMKVQKLVAVGHISQQ